VEIGIIDYGMGNLFSVSKALERLSVPYFISDDQSELMKADGLLLPGVGAYKDAMKLLDEKNLSSFLRLQVGKGVPVLGICLGMQLLFEASEENGPVQGIGLLKGKVVRFSGMNGQQEPYKVPHMGWNRLMYNQIDPLINGLEEDYVYFVHSYYVDGMDEKDLLATATYGEIKVPGIVGRGCLYGMQFHPEKSGDLGVKLLKQFSEIVKNKEA
jgi:glutamine amidotransferase